MYTVRGILRDKGNNVYTISPGERVLNAARLMNEHRVGSLVVLEDGKPVGIITERDILTRVVAAELDPRITTVDSVMSCSLLTCSESTALADIRRLMVERRVRHLPVLEGERLCGMVSIGDVNKAQAQALEHTVAHLESYIAH